MRSTRRPRRANEEDEGEHLKLILIEGLSIIPPFRASYLQRQLLPQLGEVEVEVYGWNQDVPSFLGGNHIICTHSFGFMALPKTVSAFTKAIITIDPRSWSCDFGGAASFKAPIQNTWNFYQQSWFSLHGYPVNGAINLKIDGYSHGTICLAPQIVALLKTLL